VSFGPLRVAQCAAMTGDAALERELEMRGSSRSLRITCTVFLAARVASNAASLRPFVPELLVLRVAAINVVAVWQNLHITAPAARQRSSSSIASGRAGWIETAGRNSGCPGRASARNPLGTWERAKVLQQLAVFVIHALVGEDDHRVEPRLAHTLHK